MYLFPTISHRQTINTIITYNFPLFLSYFTFKWLPQKVIYLLIDSLSLFVFEAKLAAASAISPPNSFTKHAPQIYL